MNELVKEKKNGAVSLSSQFTTAIPQLEAFTQKLNEKPDQSEVKVNVHANNSKYLPISFIRTKLDEMFAGLWNFTMIREQVIANEITGVGILEVFHPVAQTWIKRSGSAAVMIQMKAGSDMSIANKIKNTLVK